MRMPAALLLVAGLIWRGASTSAHAENRDAEVRAFVQAFYTWHVPKPDETSGDPVKRVLKDRPEVLDPALRLALEADERAQDARGQGATWSDSTSIHSRAARTPVHDTTSRKSSRIAVSTEPTSTARATARKCPTSSRSWAWRSDRWQFTNFEYPESGNLLEMLKQAVEERN